MFALKLNFLSTTVFRYLNESTCSTAVPSITKLSQVGLSLLLLMISSLVLLTFRTSSLDWNQSISSLAVDGDVDGTVLPSSSRRMVLSAYDMSHSQG